MKKRKKNQIILSFFEKSICRILDYMLKYENSLEKEQKLYIWLDPELQNVRSCQVICRLLAILVFLGSLESLKFKSTVFF